MTQDVVVILGGGVIGLTTGITFLERNGQDAVQVTLVSEDLPPSLFDRGAVGADADRAPAAYASAWAGAHHVSAATNARELRWDQTTFSRMRELEREQPWRSLWAGAATSRPLAWVEQVEVFERDEQPRAWREQLGWYPDYEELNKAALPPGAQSGCRFSTIDVNVPVYLPWLRARFEQLGGRVVQRAVRSVAEAVRIAEEASRARAAAVVVAPGLGARELEDVRDQAMHPLRGQVARVWAPHCDASIARPWSSPSPSTSSSSTSSAAQQQENRRAQHRFTGFSSCNAEGWRDCYIIPMGDGSFVVGGTRIKDDWSGEVRDETTRAVLARALSVFPELARPAASQASRDAPPDPESVEVRAVGVGLRPARTGGARLEEGQPLAAHGATCRVIYAYGFGGYGYQASWGIAQDVLNLYLARKPAQAPSARL